MNFAEHSSEFLTHRQGRSQDFVFRNLGGAKTGAETQIISSISNLMTKKGPHFDENPWFQRVNLHILILRNAQYSMHSK